MPKTISDPADSIQLQDDINSSNHWSEQWSLLFNPTKIVQVSFKPNLQALYTIGTSSITRVENHKDLGIILSSNLTWMPTIIKSLQKPTVFWDY